MFTLPPDLPGLFRSPIPVEFLLGGIGFFVPGCFCCGGGGGDGCTRAYGIGGIARSPSAAYVSDFDEFTPGTPDVWSSLDDAPSPARDGVAATAQDEIHYLGGAQLFDDHDAYASGSWNARAALPAPIRAKPGSVGINDLIYVFFGISSSSPFWERGNDEYNPIGDSWTEKGDAIAPGRGHSGVCTDGEEAYATCGNNAGRENDRYTPTGDSWASLADVPSSGAQSTSARDIWGTSAYMTEDDAVALLCGERSSVLEIRNECDTFSIPGAAWTHRSNAPTALARHCAVGLQGAAYVFFGFRAHGSPPTATLDTSEYVIDTWSERLDAPSPTRDQTGSTCR